MVCTVMGGTRNNDLGNLTSYLRQESYKEKPALTYAILDVDSMTGINKKYGEEIGNLVLGEIKRIAGKVLENSKIKKPAQQNSFTEGDQFIIMLGYTGQKTTQDLTKLITEIRENAGKNIYTKLCQAIDEPPETWKKLEKEKIRVSIGYVQIDDLELKLEETAGRTHKTALNRLRTAKSKGGGIAVGMN